MGTESEDSVDYPDFGIKVARLVSGGQVDRGILICGTGIGMSITANKIRGVRAALVQDLFTAIQSRRHVDANVLVLGRQGDRQGAGRRNLEGWLEEPFEGGRHARRIEKISKLEEECCQEIGSRVIGDSLRSRVDQRYDRTITRSRHR